MDSLICRNPQIGEKHLNWTDTREGKQLQQSIAPSRLRSFGLVIGLGFATIGFWPVLFRGQAPRAWALVVSLILTATALVRPITLKPVFQGWMEVSFILGWINTRIVLGVLFFSVFTFFALLLKLFRVDPMRRCFEPSATTYRMLRTSRPGSHLKRQF